MANGVITINLSINSRGVGTPGRVGRSAVMSDIGLIDQFTGGLSGGEQHIVNLNPGGLSAYNKLIYLRTASAASTIISGLHAYYASRLFPPLSAYQGSKMFAQLSVGIPNMFSPPKNLSTTSGYLHLFVNSGDPKHYIEYAAFGI